MSGIKDHCVTVDENALLRQRELEQARAEAAAMARDLASLLGTARAMGCADMRLPVFAASPMDGLKAYLAEAREASAELNREIARERLYRARARIQHDEEAARFERLRRTAEVHALDAAPARPLADAATSQQIRAEIARLKSLSGELVRRIGLARAEQEEVISINQPVAREDKDEEEAIGRLFEQAQAILAGLDVDIPRSQLADIERTAREIAGAASPKQAGERLAALNAAVLRANGAAAVRRDSRARCETMRDSLRGLRGAGIERLRAELEQVIDGELAPPVDLADRVEQARSEAMSLVDTEYLAETARTVLNQLGIKVDEKSFVTALCDGEAVELALPPTESSLLLFQYDRAERLITTTPASHDGGAVDGETDLRACALTQELNGKLRDHGIDVVTVSRQKLPPDGRYPDRQALNAKRKKSAAQRRRVPAARQRSL